MGLISYIKGVYYDHRIEKADELLHNGKECEAEEIYKELLGKQYTAVNKLASLYYAQFLRAGNEEDTNNIEVLFDGLSQTVTVGSCYHQHIGTTNLICKSIVQIVQCIHALGEQHQFTRWIYFFVEEFMS